MMKRITVIVLLAFCCGSARGVDLAVEYLSIPATFQFVQTNMATGVASQESKDVPLATFGMRVSQSLPPVFSGWPLSVGFETGFGLPAGTQSFDGRQYRLNSSGLSANNRFEGDSLEWSVLCVPIMATVGFVPPVSGIAIGGQAGIGVVMMDIRGDLLDSVYTGILDDLDYVETTHAHEFGSAFAVQLAGGLVVPVTETLSARLWGGAVWMSREDFSVETRKADGTSFVNGLQVGGIGFTVRVGLSSSL